MNFVAGCNETRKILTTMNMSVLGTKSRWDVPYWQPWTWVFWALSHAVSCAQSSCMSRQDCGSSQPAVPAEGPMILDPLVPIVKKTIRVSVLVINYKVPRGTIIKNWCVKFLKWSVPRMRTTVSIPIKSNN